MLLASQARAQCGIHEIFQRHAVTGRFGLGLCEECVRDRDSSNCPSLGHITATASTGAAHRNRDIRFAHHEHPERPAADQATRSSLSAAHTRCLRADGPFMNMERDSREAKRRPGSIEVVAVGRALPQVLVQNDCDQMPLADGGVSVLVTTTRDPGQLASS